jgi:catechol 2,3-dioxygenase-like lactoylglutathione lyase family enzyme
MAVRKSRKSIKTASRPASRKKTAKKSKAAKAERRRQNPETLRLRSFEPSYTVDDLERSIRFYRDVLGFVVGERWESEGVLKGVGLKAGLCELGLSQDDWAKGRDRKKGVGVRMWCTTAQDIDALAKRITAAGGRLSGEPKNEPWGVRSLSVEDPDGFHLTIYREK